MHDEGSEPLGGRRADHEQPRHLHLGGARLSRDVGAGALQYDLLADAPYRYTSDDVVYLSQGERRGIDRETFFAKGQPCLRASPLVKRYGWGVHHDAQGRVALVPVESAEYAALRADPALQQREGMRSSRA